MRTSSALIMLVLAAPWGGATPARHEANVVAYAKKIDVAKLDPTLRSQPLEEWLRLGPARVERLEWRMSDCDLHSDYKEPPNGYPLCVKVVYQRSRVSGWIIVTVGTIHKGILEPPRFEYAVVSTRTQKGMRFENAEKLSDLPRVMSELLAERRTTIHAHPPADASVRG